MPAAVQLVTWTSHVPSGGNTYNRELVTALRAGGTTTAVVEVPGTWPTPGAADAAHVAHVLRAHPCSLVDGIVAAGAPGAVAQAVRAGRRVVVLVHMAQADEVGRSPAGRAALERAEGEALRAASAVVSPSGTAAADLAVRHGLSGVHVARPGVAPAPVARGSGGAARVLLSLANLTPTKDQLTLVRALAALTDLSWEAHLVGSPEPDPGYAARVRQAVAAAGLAGRVRLPGALSGEPLQRRWDGADLLVLPSRTETFGLVVTEALARGIPAVVGAAAEALGATGPASPSGLPGAVVPPGDPTALAATLRTWLTDRGVRAAWRDAALSRRRELPGWDATAAAVRAVLRPAGR